MRGDHRRILTKGVVFLFGAGAAFLAASLPMLPVLADAHCVFRFNDNSLAFALSPFARLPAALFRYWDPQTFFGVGHRQMAASLFAILDASMGPLLFRRWGPPVLLTVTALAVYWMLRGFDLRKRACVYSAASFLFSGAVFTYAVCGLGVRPLALAFNALAIGCIERARRKRTWLLYVAAGALVGCGLAEVPDVGAFLALGTGFFLVGTHVVHRPRLPALRKTLVALVLLVGSAVLSAWQVLDIMVDTQIRDMASPEESLARNPYDWATQWSLPPVESWAIVSGTFFGSTSDSDSSPYWGKMGRTPGWEQTRDGFRNFSLTGWQLGAMPCIFLILLIPLVFRSYSPTAGPWRNRHTATLLLVGLAGTLVLAWGRFTPLYRMVLSIPFLDTIRNPEKWMIPFALFASIGVGIALDRILIARETGGADASRVYRAAAWVAGGLLAVTLLVGWGLLTHRSGFILEREQEGFGGMAEVLYHHALGVTVRTGAVLLIALALFSIPFLRRRPVIWWSALYGVTLAHLMPVASAYVKGHSDRPVRAPNALTEVLDQHRTQGRIKLYPPEHPPELGQLLNQFRLSFLTARGYEVFDPVSVSRMPADYAAFFSALRHRPFRLWELGAVRLILSGPGAVPSLNQADGHRKRFTETAAFSLTRCEDALLPARGSTSASRPLRLITFNGAVPLLYAVPCLVFVPEGPEGNIEALRRLSAPAFSPSEQAIVHGWDNASRPRSFPRERDQSIQNIQIEPTNWKVHLAPEKGPLFLVRSVKYDPDWKAFADGRPIRLFRVNYLFQGVQVPKGTRILTFHYRPSLFPLVLSGTARVVFLGLGLVGLTVRRQGREHTRKG